MSEVIEESAADRTLHAAVDAYRMLREDTGVERLPVGSRARRFRMRQLLEAAARPWGVEADGVGRALAGLVEGEA